MKMHQIIMRFLSATCERERVEFRKALSMAQAHAEDLTMSLKHGDGDALRKVMHRDGTRSKTSS